MRTTCNERLDRLFDQIDALRHHIDERFDSQAARLDMKLEAQSARLDAQTARFDEKFESLYVAAAAMGFAVAVA